MNPLHAFADEQGEGDSPSVLLVDDDEVNLLVTSSALTEQGFAVTTAGSGEQALQMLVDWVPDVIVLDAQMPGMDGFATCSYLRQRPGFETIPVLMLTGLDDEASITRAYQVGATDFFVKSPQWSLLAGRLRYMLRASRTRLELERAKSRLARAQDLARMGSFDWRRGPDSSSGGMALCRCASCCAWCRWPSGVVCCACCTACCAMPRR
jgi:CheY-like chemotaxis protein